MIVFKYPVFNRIVFKYPVNILENRQNYTVLYVISSGKMAIMPLIDLFMKNIKQIKKNDANENSLKFSNCRLMFPRWFNNYLKMAVYF